MPGWSNSDNKFGLTPYIVGQTLGDGCNYSSIQAAIDDAFAAGGGVVGIRPSTVPYVENLTLRQGVELYGFDVDGRLPSAISRVVIQGNHTFTVAGGFGAQLCQYLSFQTLAGDAFTVNATGGGQAILAMKFCGIEASTVAGQRACVLNADNTSAAQFSTDNTNVFSDSHCFESIGLGSHAASLSLGVSGSNTGDVFRHSSGSASLNFSYHNSNANTYIFNGVATNGNCFWEFSRVNCTEEAIIFPAGSSQAQVFNCEIGSNAASTYWIDGLNGQLEYVNVGFTATITGIGPSITQTKRDWQPYGESGAVPGTGVPRGTACFSSNDFVVTNGFVELSGSTTGAVTQVNGDTGSATPVAGVLQILGGPGVTTDAAGSTLTINAVQWITSGVGGLINVDTGVFDIGPNTYTTPAAPIEGETVKFYSWVAPSELAANAGQNIQLGNATGTLLTSTSIGDYVELTYYLGSNTWACTGVIGNWILT